MNIELQHVLLSSMVSSSTFLGLMWTFRYRLKTYRALRQQHTRRTVHFDDEYTNRVIRRIRPRPWGRRETVLAFAFFAWAFYSAESDALRFLLKYITKPDSGPYGWFLTFITGNLATISLALRVKTSWNMYNGMIEFTDRGWHIHRYMPALSVLLGICVWVEWQSLLGGFLWLAVKLVFLVMLYVNPIFGRPAIRFLLHDILINVTLLILSTLAGYLIH